MYTQRYTVEASRQANARSYLDRCLDNRAVCNSYRIHILILHSICHFVFFFFLLFSSLTWKISYLIAWVLNSQTIRSLRRAASPTTNFIYFLQVDGWKLCLCSMYSMTMFEYDDHGFERLVEHWISLERRKYQMVQIQTKSDSLIYTRKKNIRYT